MNVKAPVVSKLVIAWFDKWLIAKKYIIDTFEEISVFSLPELEMTHVNCLSPLSKPRWLLEKSGLWPMEIVTKFIALKYLLNFVFDVVVLGIVLHNIVNALKANNINLLNWMTCVLLPLLNYYTKAITLFVNRDYLKSILCDLEGDVFNCHSEKLNRYVRLIYKISNLMIRYFAFVLTTFISIFGVLPILTNIRPIIPASFNTGKYAVLYNVAHLFAVVFMGSISTAFDVLYMSFMALCGAQLDILKERIMNIQQDANELYKNLTYKKQFASTNSLVEAILKECIILHEATNSFVKKLDVLLSFPLIIQYVIGCFIICNTILQLTILSNPNSTNIIGLCGYSGVVFAQIAAYHWLGNEILFKSDSIIEACYLSNWYKLDLRSQKCLILLMERAKRPLVITLYKFVFISLTSLGVIIRWSYSIFALIKARYN